jgi:hypothetical protein
MVVEEPIPLMEGKEELKETPPITLGDEGIYPPMLDETFMLEIETFMLENQSLEDFKSKKLS